jgi:hypothetical protein
MAKINPSWAAAVRRGFVTEARFGDLLGKYFAPVEYAKDEGYDFRMLDGRYVIELKFALVSSRDLYESVLRLVFALGEHPEIERGVLVANCSKMGRERLLFEWERIQKSLVPEVGKRLGLVAIAADGDVVVPDEPRQRQLLSIALETFPREETFPESKRAAERWSAKTFEVFKVLVTAWLRSEGLLPIWGIIKRSGCSHPTVRIVINLLERRKELIRGSDRSAGLAHLPRESLREVLVLADELRLTTRFVDGSGRRPDPIGLIRRLNEKKPEGVAFGGVAAARHYQPEFDLNGLPRIDLTIEGDRSLDWLAKVDPALKPVESSEQVPLLVVHRLLRPLAQFDEGTAGGLPFADPAEVLLDLYDLRLTEQAEEFVRSLRAKGTDHV